MLCIDESPQQDKTAQQTISSFCAGEPFDRLSVTRWWYVQ
jgi:hypothetical protein